jgi:hypothetical protein
MASLEMPVGTVRRTQAGYARSGSRLRLHPYHCVSIFWRKSACVTYVVQINVDSSKMVEHKVSYRIGALDRVPVGIKGLKEPRISKIG